MHPEAIVFLQVKTRGRRCDGLGKRLDNMSIRTGYEKIIIDRTIDLRHALLPAGLRIAGSFELTPTNHAAAVAKLNQAIAVDRQANSLPNYRPRSMNRCNYDGCI